MRNNHVLLIGDISDRMTDQLKPHFTLHRPGDLPSFLAEKGDKITHALNVGHTQIHAGIFTALPNLKILSNYGVGYDNIDASHAAEQGIMVTHTPGVLNEEVATTAIMLMLACYRNLVTDDAYVRAGRWVSEGNAPLSRSADGRTVGVLGMGRIGEAIARKLQAFDATVVYHTRTPKDVPYRHYDNLVQMARDVDVLIVITPGGAATRHLVNAEVLKALGPEGVLINVARGTVVDEAALVKALTRGQLGWAGLDVFEDEPRVPEALFEMKNVVLLPHVGSGTVETRQAMGDLAVENLVQFKATGQALTPVPECQGG